MPNAIRDLVDWGVLRLHGFRGFTRVPASDILQGLRSHNSKGLGILRGFLFEALLLGF